MAQSGAVSEWAGVGLGLGPGQGAVSETGSAGPDRPEVPTRGQRVKQVLDGVL